MLIPIDWHTIEAHESFAVDQERLHRFVKMFEASAKDEGPPGKNNPRVLGRISGTSLPGGPSDRDKESKG